MASQNQSHCVKCGHPLLWHHTITDKNDLPFKRCCSGRGEQGQCNCGDKMRTDRPGWRDLVFN